jgi:hypothetical protein
LRQGLGKIVDVVCSLDLTKINSVGSFPNDPRARGRCVQTGAGHNSRVAEYSVSVRSFMWTGRAELLTSPIMPGTSPVFEPTFDFCESAVFTIVLKMQQLFSPHGFRCIYSTMVKTATPGAHVRLDSGNIKICSGHT